MQALVADDIATTSRHGADTPVTTSSPAGHLPRSDVQIASIEASEDRQTASSTSSGSSALDSQQADEGQPPNAKRQKAGSYAAARRVVSARDCYARRRKARSCAAASSDDDADHPFWAELEPAPSDLIGSMQQDAAGCSSMQQDTAGCSSRAGNNTCAMADYCRSAVSLSVNGYVVIKPAGLEAVLMEKQPDIVSLLHAVSGASAAIFQHFEPTDDSELRSVDHGDVRKQWLFLRVQHGSEAVNVQWDRRMPSVWKAALQDIIRVVLRVVPTGNFLEKATLIINNITDATPADKITAQDPHMDEHVPTDGLAAPVVVILPLQVVGCRLHMYEGSHRTTAEHVRQCRQVSKLLKEAFGANGEDFWDSQAAVDVDKQMSKVLPTLQSTACDVAYGNLVMFDSNLLHSGAAGKVGEPALRLHLAFNRKGFVLGKNGTWPAIRLGDNMISLAFSENNVKAITNE